PADFLVRLLFSAHLRDRLISWKFVQPVTPEIGSEALSLKVPHSRLSELHPADLADIFLDLGTEARVAILRSLDTATAAHMFQELPLRLRVQIAESMALDQLVDIINEMPMDEVVDLVSELPKKKVNSLFTKLPREKVEQIAHLLEHSNRVAGGIMNTEFVCVKPSDTAAAVLDMVRGEARKKESIYYLYVVNDNNVLLGVFTLRQLFILPPEKTVSEFMRRRLAKVREDTNVREVAEIFYKYDFTVVPVVDRQNKLQGIITMKDAFEAVFHEIKEEAEETA
ncbi:MAG: CBS domain-containing protein, partial [Endomicrobiales bacterium]